MVQWTGITAEMTVREVLAVHPETRAIFDNYGMMGCGGVEGPPEPVRFFAEMHGLETPALIAELESAIEHKRIPLTPRAAEKADSCGCGMDEEKQSISPRAARLLSAPEPKGGGSKCTHGESSKTLARTLTRTALVVFLSYGGLVGLVAFLALTQPSFALPEILAWPALVQSHAHAQVYGFAAMFVLGISYHVMPRFMGVPLRNVAMAWTSYGLLLAGVLMRSLYQPFAQNPAAGVTALIGSALEIGAVIAFLSVVRATVREHQRSLLPGRAGQPFVHIAYLMVGGAAFLGSALISFAGAVFMLVRQVNVQPAVLNAVWINLAVVGVVGMFIFGVGQRTMPHFLGLEHLRPAAGKAALGFLALGLAIQAAAVLFGPQKILIAVSAILELTGFIVFLTAVPLVSRPPVHRPAAPPLFASFVRSAFAWGLLGSAGFAVLSVVDAAGVAVPRVAADAYRHAWTLGWITTLIIGVGYRILPIFFGKEIRRPAAIPVVYGCLMAAVVLRVGADILSLQFPSVYPWTAVSGALALIAVFLFAVEVWGLTSKEDDAVGAAAPEITESSNVATVLDSHPELLPVFVRHGLGALQNPVARKTVARFVTIGQAARRHGIDQRDFLAELNRTLTQGGLRR